MGRDEKFGSGFLQESMANERTFLAWIRTCIALIGLGFIIAKFGLFVEEFNLVFYILLVVMVLEEEEEEEQEKEE